MTQAPKSQLEDTLAFQMKAARLPTPIRQFFAIPGRKLAFDFGFPDWRLLVEVQGGVWTKGKHGRGSGIIGDQNKLNLAVLNGYFTLQFSVNHIDDGSALQTIQRAFRVLPKIERP
jgi:hypothetical protein